MRSLLTFALLITFSTLTKAQDTAVYNRQAFESFADTRGTEVPSFHYKEATKGSQYLFSDWKRGKAINAEGKLVDEPGLSFNYDKMHHGLYMTKDKKTSYIIDLHNVKEIMIDDNGNQLEFVHLPQVNEESLLLVLIKNPTKYSLYKSLTTKFIKSNYVTTGLTETGHNYDEYLDEPIYYLYTLKGTFEKIPSWKKGLKGYFDGNKTAEAFLKDHRNDDIDDNFMKDLVETLNK